MKIYYILLAYFFSSLGFAQARSILEDKSGSNELRERLRTGDIKFEEIPNIILTVTNNILSLVGYLCLAVVLIGAFKYTLSGINEEWKSQGKETVKMALFGAVVAWSAWAIVNFFIDNI